MKLYLSQNTTIKETTLETFSTYGIADPDKDVKEVKLFHKTLSYRNFHKKRDFELVKKSFKTPVYYVNFNTFY